jgi:hypothetical protein
MAEGKIGVGAVARMAERPGRSFDAERNRFKKWVAAGIIPPDGEVPAPGGKAFVYPQTAGAIFAIMSELYDAAIAVSHRELRGLWDYLAESHADGCHPHITHILDAVEKEEACWLIFTLWKDEVSGAYVKTCCTRFEDQADKPINAPSADHDPAGEYIVQLHKLLKRFAVIESNVQTLKAVQ